MNPIDFEGKRSKVKFTMDIYGDKLVNTIETKPVPLCISSSKFAEKLTLVRGWTLLILEVRGQRSRSQWTRMKISCEPYTDLTIVWFLINLGRHVNHGLGKPYWFWRSEFKGEDHDGYHWQMWGARGCYALRCYIYLYLTLTDLSQSLDVCCNKSKLRHLLRLAYYYKTHETELISQDQITHSRFHYMNENFFPSPLALPSLQLYNISCTPFHQIIWNHQTRSEY